ncbi:unnamed protein product, partial [Discosporangium mesarthrocarpum]
IFRRLRLKPTTPWTMLTTSALTAVISCSGLSAADGWAVPVLNRILVEPTLRTAQPKPDLFTRYVRRVSSFYARPRLLVQPMMHSSGWGDYMGDMGEARDRERQSDDYGQRRRGEGDGRRRHFGDSWSSDDGQ